MARRYVLFVMSSEPLPAEALEQIKKHNPRHLLSFPVEVESGGISGIACTVGHSTEEGLVHIPSYRVMGRGASASLAVLDMLRKWLSCLAYVPNNDA
jgi:hypothetical protein